MSMRTGLVGAVLCCWALVAEAFMPAGGLWVVDVENNGQPGRGMQIEVENGVLVFTYYGFRQDGSSVFYLAAGPLAAHSFTGELSEYRNGKTLGGSAQSASGAGSAGSVKITFSSGLHGTITFPGESPLAISKFEFGYGPDADSLLGSYLFTYIGSTSEFTEYYTLSHKLNLATTYGSGAVSDASDMIRCENQISGTLAGWVVCTETGTSSYRDQYAFKIAGDRGTGTGTWPTSSYYYPLHVLRTALRTGESTGLNEGTMSSLSIRRSTEGSRGLSEARDQTMGLEGEAGMSIRRSTEGSRGLSEARDQAKALQGEAGSMQSLSPAQQAAQKAWAIEVLSQ